MKKKEFLTDKKVWKNVNCRAEINRLISRSVISEIVTKKMLLATSNDGEM